MLRSQNSDVNMSLQTLRTNLLTLSMPGSVGQMSRTQRQRLLEESSYDAARQLYIHEMEELAKVGKDKERGLQSNWLQTIMFEWLKHFERTLFEASCETGKGSPWGKDADIEPFMRLLSPDKMALITIVELMRLCGSEGVTGGMKAARAILTIGRAIENEYHAERSRRATRTSSSSKRSSACRRARSVPTAACRAARPRSRSASCGAASCRSASARATRRGALRGRRRSAPRSAASS